jgi:hypothetical protein
MAHLSQSGSAPRLARNRAVPLRAVTLATNVLFVWTTWRSAFGAGLSLRLVALTFFAHVGCGGAAPTPAISDQVAQVDVRLSLPPPGARSIGAIEAVHGRGCGSYGRAGTMEGALANLKTEAARRGANYVHVTRSIPPHLSGVCFDQRFQLAGIAYVIGSGYSAADEIELPERDGGPPDGGAP